MDVCSTNLVTLLRPLAWNVWHVSSRCGTLIVHEHEQPTSYDYFCWAIFCTRAFTSPALSLVQESLLSKKVYQHMLKRTQREQAILKQKLFQMEDFHMDVEVTSDDFGRDKWIHTARARFMDFWGLGVRSTWTGRRGSCSRSAQRVSKPGLRHG